MFVLGPKRRELHFHLAMSHRLLGIEILCVNNIITERGKERSLIAESKHNHGARTNKSSHGAVQSVAKKTRAICLTNILKC
jgi:hypothetical protein